MTHITLLFQIKFFRFYAYFWLKLEWNFIQMIPPWEIWHITVLFQIKFSQICADFWLKLVWNFIQKIPPCELWHITLLFKIIISSIFAQCWLKLSMKLHSNDNSLRNMTQNTSIPNQNFSIFAYFWLKLVWNFIQMISPWEIWRVTLQFKIINSWIFAYC